MKIFVNLSSVYKGGAEQVALSFIDECKQHTTNNYYIFLCDNLFSKIATESFPNNFIFFKINHRPGKGISSYFKFIKYMNLKEKEIKPDCVLSTSSHGYWIPNSAPVISGFNIPHYVYPESPYFKNMSVVKRLFWFFKKKIHFNFYNRLNSIFVQTDDVNNRLKKILNKKVKVYTISNTVNAHYLNPKKYVNRLEEKKEGEYRLLTLSSYYPHKNIEIIAPLIELLKKQQISKFKFIVTLPQDKFNVLFGSGSKDYITNVGPVPIQECPSLYKECDAMFLPTLLECFSASYAEAMLMKKPILTSDLGFAHTVCKDAALYFNPIDANDILNKIIQLSNDTALQKQLIGNGSKTLKMLNSASERATRILEICSKTQTN